MNWAGFQRAAPDLAARAHDAFEHFGFVLVGTVRRDGTPRISPVEVHIVLGQMMLVLIAGSQKARDLVRDPRVVLHTPVTDPGSPEGEITVRGRVVDADGTRRAAAADAIEATSGWRPGDAWRFCVVVLEAVSSLEWDGETMTLSRWDQTHGLRPTERRRLDMEASRYVPLGE